MRITEKLFSHPSINNRYFAFEGPDQLVDEDPDRRMDRYAHWAVKLSSRAARVAMDRAGVGPSDVSALVVNTCTGYICPGISNYLIEGMGLSRSLRAYDLVGSGCGGAIPNIQVCEGLLSRDEQGVALSVSVEICSATYQMGNDPSLIVSNAIFGDGAAASVVWRHEGGLRLMASHSLHLPEHREDIRYVYKGGQLHNQLSVSLPGKSGRAVAELIRQLIAPFDLSVADIKHWAIHAGGAKVIDAVRDQAGLTEQQCTASRRILSDYGNMSSATVWFVLQDLWQNGMADGDWGVMVAFGAGLSAHAYLLRL
jgi:alkylresorcinol/alkylpyrone synthase